MTNDQEKMLGQIAENFPEVLNTINLLVTNMSILTGDLQDLSARVEALEQRLAGLGAR